MELLENLEEGEEKDLDGLLDYGRCIVKCPCISQTGRRLIVLKIWLV